MARSHGKSLEPVAEVGGIIELKVSFSGHRAGSLHEVERREWQEHTSRPEWSYWRYWTTSGLSLPQSALRTPRSDNSAILRPQIAALTEQLAEARQIIADCKPKVELLGKVHGRYDQTGIATVYGSPENHDIAAADCTALLQRIAAWEAKQ